MKIDENTAIKCNNIEEVRDCFNKLEELGFAFKDDYSFEDRFLVFYNTYEKAFLNNIHFYISKDHNYINYKYFLKLYNKQIKEKEPEKKQPNLLVDKNGKILKVNDFKDKAVVYYTNLEDLSIIEEGISCKDLKNKLYNRDYFISEEVCQKAEKRNIIRRKLETLAFELNGNKDIDWDNEKDKYYIYYDLKYNLIG